MPSNVSIRCLKVFVFFRAPVLIGHLSMPSIVMQRVTEEMLLRCVRMFEIYLITASSAAPRYCRRAIIIIIRITVRIRFMIIFIFIFIIIVVIVIIIMIIIIS